MFSRRKAAHQLIFLMAVMVAMATRFSQTDALARLEALGVRVSLRPENGALVVKPRGAALRPEVRAVLEAKGSMIRRDLATQWLRSQVAVEHNATVSWARGLAEGRAPAPNGPVNFLEVPNTPVSIRDPVGYATGKLARLGYLRACLEAGGPPGYPPAWWAQRILANLEALGALRQAVEQQQAVSDQRR